MKNIVKKILIGGVSLTIIIIIVSAIIIIKNKSLEAEKNIETTTSKTEVEQNIAEEKIPEIEEITENETNEAIEEVIQEEITIEPEIQSKPTEVVKPKENITTKAQTQNTKQNNKISENPSTTTSVAVQTNNNDNTRSNSEERNSTSNINNNSIPNPQLNTSNNKSTEPTNQKVETFKYNKQMTDKMIGVITANESEYMKQYGYNVVVDESIIANTNQFTFTESRIKSSLTYKFGTIKVYARDYYVNGQYMWTECFII